MAHLILAATRAASLALRLLCLTSMALGALAFAQDGRQSKVFDHAATGFDLAGAHQFVACESCHIEGQFVGTPMRCEGCHQMNGRFNAHFKPVDHILSSNQCDHCHKPTLWQDITHVDHTQVFGECVQCHNGVQATGKPPHHIPTHNRCVDCHSGMAFVPSFFSHEGIDSGCAVCHNGVTATGRGPDHIPIRQPICESCHTNPLAWAPIPRVDHSLVIGSCVSCHNNATAPGQPAGHIRASENCDACHSEFNWSNPVVDHSEIPAVEACVDCHNNVVAQGQPPCHPITTTLYCGACHATTHFLPFRPDADLSQLQPGSVGACDRGMALSLSCGQVQSLSDSECRPEASLRPHPPISYYVGEF